jgi:uncharacterized protein
MTSHAKEAAPLVNRHLPVSQSTDAAKFECRPGCGACCIAPSISSVIPEMPDGKPAGVRCVQLSVENRCLIFGLPERPKVCAAFAASLETCGESRETALQNLTELEAATTPLA